MLDQLFTTENFREIYDEVNRKGHDVGRRYFPQLQVHREAIAAKRAEIIGLKSIKNFMSSADYSHRLNVLLAEAELLRDEKEHALLACIDSVALEASNSRFRITLSMTATVNGKNLYSLDDSASTFFASKQVQKNLRRIYKIQPANRYEQISRLLSCFGTKFPLRLLRTDITSFFENIPAEKVLNKINADRILAESSRMAISSVMKQYRELSETNRGIPRGVGLSSYIAELYLRTLDDQLRNVSGVCLYLRYVDDIVIVASVNPYSAQIDLRAEVEKAFTTHGLTMNSAKTSEHDLSHAVRQEFSFLGYQFANIGRGWQLSPSSTRLARYEARLECSFQAYEKDKSRNGRRAYRLLVSRVRFLTGNTRLLNSKSQASTGIFFNNSMSTDLSFLERLDTLLKRKTRTVLNRKLRARLSTYSFKKGFEEREFRHFSAQELSRVVEIWAYVN